MSFLPKLRSFADASAMPATFAAQQRNTILDWLFYDVELLTEEERATLIHDRNIEGSILVVWPTGGQGVRKFEDYAALRSEPGKLLQRFTIAGVGSSDVGAAAFARTLADHYQEPVGAIVAGYGVSDLLSEALGGWFVLGTANRVLKLYQDALQSHQPTTAPKSLPSTNTKAEIPEAAVSSLSNDTLTLLRLLKDDDREILTIAGHSKGCLSIAYALEALAVGSDNTALAKAKNTRIITTGAIIALPSKFSNAGQYLGAIDWFGALNSRLDVSHKKVGGAWHHLNTALPMHMSFSQVLRDNDE